MIALRSSARIFSRPCFSLSASSRSSSPSSTALLIIADNLCSPSGWLEDDFAGRGAVRKSRPESYGLAAFVNSEQELLSFRESRRSFEGVQNLGPRRLAVARLEVGQCQLIEGVGAGGGP